jgi:hypothetical protein
MCRVELLCVAQRPANIVEVSFLQRFVELLAEIIRHAAHLRHHLAERPKHWRQILRTHHDDQDDGDNDELGPADIKHSLGLHNTEKRQGLPSRPGPEPNA